MDTLFNAESDEGFSADELAQIPDFAEKTPAEENRHNETASQRVIRTLFDMSQAGIIQKNLLLTAFVRYKVKNSSSLLLEKNL